MKGGVELVPTHDDEEDRAWLAREREPDEEKQWLDEAAAAAPSRWRCLTQPLTPDTWRFLPTEHVRLLKFMLVSYALVVATHAFIRAHASTDKWERDERYSLDEFHLLDLHPCALDALWFFVVGRYWRRNGVDSACFLGPCVLGAYVFSAVGSWPVTHESISLYAIKCVWPRAFVALLGGVVALVLALALLHVWRACKDGLFGGRVAEIACTVLIFWLPRARDSQFHVHHWFLTWFIGQHANQDAWWSVASSGILWGGYVNGVAAWGRDHPLGCKASYYASENQRCGYMECFEHRYYVVHNATAMPPPADSFEASDWRHCGASYAP